MITRIIKEYISVAVFDSGVGGLSVLKSLQTKMPDISYYYIYDNLYFPYGLKEKSFLESRVYELIHKVISLYDIDIIVLACNTASTSTLSFLRSKLNVPIIGVVPAVKVASSMSKTKIFGVLATKATIKQVYLSDLIEKYCHMNEVIKHASSKLVEIAEQKMHAKPYHISQIQKEIKPLLDCCQLDTIVLACTHFPHLKEDFLEIAPSINWIDSCEAIANRLSFIVNSLYTTNKKEKKQKEKNNLALYTDKNYVVTDDQKKLWKSQFKFREIKNLEI